MYIYIFFNSPSVHPDKLQVLLGAVGAVRSSIFLLHDGFQGVLAARLP